MSNKAVFLDRDGVIVNNSRHYYIWQKSQLELVDGIEENLKFLSALGYLIFIVSNQGGIARGIYSRNDVVALHEAMITGFRMKNIVITDVLFCPHHPEIEKCLCRKPGPLMLEKLIARYRISKDESYFIGDSESDMDAARNAGIAGIKIEPNQNMASCIAFLKND